MIRLDFDRFKALARCSAQERLGAASVAAYLSCAAIFGGSAGTGTRSMTIKVGDTLPQVNLMTTTADGIAPTTTNDIFKGKRVGLFAVPGAFTPTCSAKHMPGFKAHADELKAKGLDAIACVSVNDAFVMKAWAKDQGVDGEIIMLADGNGEFTKALGLELDGSRFGMGGRSLRYSLVAKDGVVEQLNVEEGGEFKVSSAEYLLEHL
jgi:glutaredoxin/glutathione-dependent peroxiredoxin